LDRNNSLFLRDPLEKTAEEQVQSEDILLDLLHNDQSDKEVNDEGDDEGGDDEDEDEDEYEYENTITVQ
jgi:hypothetical protein